MLKRVFGVRRRDGVPHEELVEAWRDEHIPNVVRDLSPDRYAVTFFRQREGTPFDGMAVLGFDDADRGRSAFTPSDPPKACFADALVERSTRAFVFDATERVQVDGPRGPFKSVTFVTKVQGRTMADLVHHWLDVHAPAVAGAAEEAGIGRFRYVISVGEGLPDDARYHGVAELYYDDADAWKAHGRALRPDGFEAVADLARSANLVGQEVLVR